MTITSTIAAGLIVLGLQLATPHQARACSIFCDAGDGRVFAGRNWDMIDDGEATAMWFVPAERGSHGRVCFGRHDDCEDGMNDEGLFVAIAAAPPNGKFLSKQRPYQCEQALDELLAKCANLEQAIQWLKRTTNIIINGSVRGSNQKGFRNSGIGGHYLIADKTGASAVCEWEKGKPKIIRKDGRYQLITNFLLTKPKGEEKACPRFCSMTAVLKTSEKPSFETATKALKTASHPITRYSLVCDLVKVEVHVFFNHDFAAEKAFLLSEELRGGPRELPLQELFGREANYLRMPVVRRDVPLSAREILEKALEARGGAEMAKKIKSLHAKGTLVFEIGWLGPSTYEMFAVRPNKCRYICEGTSAVGTNAFSFAGGFDGKNGWQGERGRKPEKLKREELEEKRAEAEFFGWYDDPGRCQSARCPGEVLLEGRACYAIELVDSRGRKETHYYDTNTFLLAAQFRTSPAGPATVEEKTTYADYRDFDGFRFPTRIVYRAPFSGGEIHYRTVELNVVDGESVSMQRSKFRTSPPLGH